MEEKRYQVCSRCGKKFIPDSRHRTICSEKYRKMGRKRNENRNPNTELVQLAIEAREAGMSYGKYVARRLYRG